MIPKGLRLHSTPLVAEKAASKVSQWFAEILHEAELNLVNSLIRHYDVLLDRFRETRAEIGKHLTWLERQDIYDLDWSSVNRDAALANKELNARRESLKTEHEAKLLALVNSLPSTESESATASTRDQEKQAKIGLLGIEPNLESDQEDEDREQGDHPLIYPRHVAEGSPQAKRAWSIIENWMCLENPAPSPSDKNPVTFAERKRRLAIRGSAGSKRPRTDDDGTTDSGRQGEENSHAKIPLVTRNPVFSYRYTGRRRRQRHRRHTAIPTTTTNNQKTAKKEKTPTQKLKKTTTTNYDGQHKQTHYTAPGATAGATTVTPAAALGNASTPEPTEAVTAPPGGDASAGRATHRTISPADNRSRKRRRRKRARRSLTRAAVDNDTLSLSTFPLYSPPKLLNKMSVNVDIPAANTHTQKRRRVRKQVRHRIRDKRRSVIHLSEIRRKRALLTREKRLEKAKRCITCAGDVSLTDTEILVLAKGLTFVPTESRPNRNRLLKEFDSFACKLRRQYIMSKRKEQSAVSYERHPYAPPSKWIPTTTDSGALEEYIRKTRTSIKNMPVTIPKFNLTLPERRALRELGRRRDIVIKKADKGACIVVQSRDEYIEKGTLHVNDTKTYTPLEANPTAAIGEAINESVQEFLDANLIDQITANYLRHESTDSIRTQVLYFLRKIHKNPHGFRPIVSGCSGPTEKISAYVDRILQPIVKLTTSYLRDSSAFIHYLETTRFPKNVILVTIDVSALYTSIPQREGIQACVEAAREHYPNEPDVPNIVSTFLQYILQANVFEFDRKIFLQKHGTAMGTKVAPCFANLFMSGLESVFLEKESRFLPEPLRWKRYIDDIWLTWPYGEESLLAFLNRLNKFNKHIKFTWDYSTQEAVYLDVKVFKGERFARSGILDTQTYFKPTNAFTYVHASSAHHPSVFKGLVKGEATRYLRTTSSKETYEETLAKFKQRLVDRDYNPRMIDDILKTMPFDKRPEMLEKIAKDLTATELEGEVESNTTTPSTQPIEKRFKNAPLVFPTVYTRWFPKIRDKLGIYWECTMGRDPTLKRIFPKFPIMAYKRASNLAQQIVKAKLPKPEIFPGPDPPRTDEYPSQIRVPRTGLKPRCHPCNTAQCGVCPILNVTSGVVSTSTKRSYPISTDLTCKSTNVIYVLQCKHCNKQYVGETSKSFIYRMKHHRNAANGKDEKILKRPLYRHFKELNLSFNDNIRATLVDKVPDTAQLKIVEKHWIEKMGTRLPVGFNSHY